MLIRCKLFVVLLFLLVFHVVYLLSMLIIISS
jgi:hypothetical protein